MFAGLRSDRLRLTGSAANALIKLEMLAADVDGILQVRQGWNAYLHAD